MEFKKLQTSLQSVDKELDARKRYVCHVAGTNCPVIELVPYEMITFILNRTYRNNNDSIKCNNYDDITAIKIRLTHTHTHKQKKISFTITVTTGI